MTSNVGSQIILESRGQDDQKNQEIILNTLKQYFRPEFLNRVDEVVIFNFLKKAQIKNIVDIQIEKLNASLQEHKIKLVLTEKAKEFLAEKGFNPDYGARPLKRAIQNYIQNPLSLKLLEERFSDEDLIEVDLDNKDISFKKIGKIET